jgi:hypothetical protein
MGWLAGLAVLAAVGCATEKLPEYHAVTGRVTLAGQPLTSGSVSYRSVDPGNTEQPTGVIDPQGQYTLYTQQRPGAPPGKYRVIVFANEGLRERPGTAAPGLPKSLISRRFQNPKTTPLERTVQPSAPPAHYDLEVTK